MTSEDSSLPKNVSELIFWPFYSIRYSLHCLLERNQPYIGHEKLSFRNRCCVITASLNIMLYLFQFEVRRHPLLPLTPTQHWPSSWQRYAQHWHNWCWCRTVPGAKQTTPGCRQRTVGTQRIIVSDKRLSVLFDISTRNNNIVHASAPTRIAPP